MRLGLVGYAKGGRYFHAPYIAAAPGVEFVGVVTRDEGRRADVAADFPGLPVFDALEDVVAAGADTVTITTPPATRRELVLRALAAGANVIADKPFAPSAAAAQELVDAAAHAARALNVFHNRRWDADVATVAALLAERAVGTPWRVESRFDLDEPEGLEAGPDGGLLRDLGTHLVDQLTWLLGPVVRVFAQVASVQLAAGITDAAFAVELTHASGVRSRASATKLNHNVEREWRVYGSAGSYISRGSDVQTAAIFAGRRPAVEGASWGYEDESRWGVLATSSGQTRVPSRRGNYADFYAQFAAALRGDAAFPVPGEEGVRTLAVLDAARLSALEGRVVEVPASPRR